MSLLGRVSALAAIVALALVATSVLDAAAQPRSCGEVQRALPKPKQRDGGRPPLLIGDSVLLRGVKRAAAAGFEVNVRGCRTFVEGVRIVRSRRRAGTLPRVVVLALGANWVVPEREVEWALAEVGDQRTLVLVTPRERDGGAGADARVIRAAGAIHPDRIRVLDWVAFSRGHANWFYGDGLHLTPHGARAYLRLLRRVV